MEFNNHPLIAIKNVIDRYNDKKLVFNFSRYTDGKNGKTINREIFEVESSKINEEWVETQISKLKQNEEFAITSLVKYDNKEYHLPLIDFKIGEWNNELLSDIVYKPKIPFFLFESGSSYHGYSSILITHNEWIYYLGKLLLLNKRQSKEIVDSSWIAHSLQRNFCTLRLSNNCKKTMPKLFYTNYSIKKTKKIIMCNNQEDFNIDMKNEEVLLN
jgi:hypothetical protein